MTLDHRELNRPNSAEIADIPGVSIGPDGAIGVVNVIDDDASLRNALSNLFTSVGLSVRTFGSAREFQSAAQPDEPSCLVVDIRLPGLSGLDLQSALSERGIDLPIIFMTAHGDVPMSVRAMKAGAVDFLTKPFRDQDMLDAVTKAIEGDRIHRIESKDLEELEGRFETLSPREREVMKLATTGKMNKQIAGDLNLSEVTVKIHRGAAMKKMAARNFADLVRIAERLGLGD
ncbi:MAG TPA: response regulator transcription factor [Sphingomicrobium sp.]|nr:response regulator transcription factor [Sphingomicrobium sp.]